MYKHQYCKRQSNVGSVMGSSKRESKGQKLFENWNSEFAQELQMKLWIQIQNLSMCKFNKIKEENKVKIKTVFEKL